MRKNEADKLAVIVTVDGKVYQVLLTEDEVDSVFSLLKLMHQGEIKVIDKELETIELA